MPSNKDKKAATFQDFSHHVSSGKARFFQSYRMDFVPGARGGCYLHDIEGDKQLFNLHCNGGVFNLGHRHPELIAVLKDGLEQWDIGNHHLISQPRAEAAKLLAGLMPGDLNYVVYGVGGGEAADLAIKVARAFTGKDKIISATGGYHGHTGLALAAGDAKYREVFGPQAPGFQQVPFGQVTPLHQAIDENTAAVILETVPATLGIVVPPPGYLQAVRRLCDEKGVLLILDEVQSGLGRTGKLWAFEHFGVTPDIVILGKGLSGGIYPIAATVLSQRLESVFHADPFIHVSTFGGSELGCLVMKRVLEITADPGFLAHVNEMAERFREGVAVLQQKHKGFLVGFRQLGLMMGLELKDELAGPALTKAAYDNGLLMVYANNDTRVCQFLPPLIIEAQQVEEVFSRLDKALSDAKRMRRLIQAKRMIDKLASAIKIKRQ
ncbi:MAG: aspartate aminotransferase family protein [Phaeodactylibacter sp.]|nr:aspartate aminotransferase family protein [Phaeodactylibacter sp.]MCB9050783.1 aspartate aminotransferase family protein [Lewinellaceae bacterium]